MRFLNIRVALDFKTTPLKTFLKNLDLPQSYDCFRNTKKGVLCTAKLKHPLHQVGMSFYWLFGTFHVFAAGALSPSSFEPSIFFEFFFFFFFDRTLAANASLCQLQCTAALSPLKPELK